MLRLVSVIYVEGPLLNSQNPYFVNFLQLHTFENAILIDRL